MFLYVFQVDTLDSWILYKFGPKGKYPTHASVPKLVSRAEIESAKSKFRIFINLVAIVTLVVTATYLVYGARVHLLIFFFFFFFCWVADVQKSHMAFE